MIKYEIAKGNIFRAMFTDCFNQLSEYQIIGIKDTDVEEYKENKVYFDAYDFGLVKKEKDWEYDIAQELISTLFNSKKKKDINLVKVMYVLEILNNMFYKANALENDVKVIIDLREIKKIKIGNILYAIDMIRWCSSIRECRVCLVVSDKKFEKIEKDLDFVADTAGISDECIEAVDYMFDDLSCLYDAAEKLSDEDLMTVLNQEYEIIDIIQDEIEYRGL